MVLRLIDQQLESRQAACIYVRNELADVAQDIERENVACIIIGRCLDLDAEPVKIAVAPTCDIPENETRTIAMNGKLVLVARTIADARAIENRCSHALQALEGRKLRGGAYLLPCTRRMLLMRQQASRIAALPMTKGPANPKPGGISA